MQKNSDNFSMQEALRLANSPAGQQLLAMLQQSDKETLQKIMAQISAGDYSNAQYALSALLSSPEARQLMKQLGGK